MTEHQITLLLLMAETDRPMELYDFMKELSGRYIDNISPSKSGRFNMIVTPRLLGSLDALQAMNLVVRGNKEGAPVHIGPYGDNRKMVAAHLQTYKLTEAGEAFVRNLTRPAPKPALRLT